MWGRVGRSGFTSQPASKSSLAVENDDDDDDDDGDRDYGGDDDDIDFDVDDVYVYDDGGSVFTSKSSKSSLTVADDDDGHDCDDDASGKVYELLTFVEIYLFVAILPKLSGHKAVSDIFLLFVCMI